MLAIGVRWDEWVHIGASRVRVTPVPGESRDLIVEVDGELKRVELGEWFSVAGCDVKFKGKQLGRTRMYIEGDAEVTRQAVLDKRSKGEM